MSDRIKTIRFYFDLCNEFVMQLCSLDEDFALTVWTVVDSWTDPTKISERKNAGTAPWSSVRLVRTQIVQANKYVPG